MDIENKMSDIQKGYNVESEVEYLKSRVKKLEDENIRLKRLLNEAGISYECSCNQIPDISLEKARLFFSYFWGRSDVYAKRYVNKSTGVSGYFPQCSNFWRYGVCPKANRIKVQCKNCENKAWVKLGAKQIEAHLRGSAEDCSDVIGVYPLFADGTCRFLAFDFDNHNSDNDDFGFESNDINWMSEVNALREICTLFDIPVLVERSRSGKGAHVWIFFEKPIDAAIARQFGFTLLEKGAEYVNLTSFRYYDRMLPAQEELKDGGIGNLIALPLQGKAVKNGNSVFVNNTWEPYDNQWQILKDTKKLSEADVKGFLERNKSNEENTDNSCADKPWQRNKHFLKSDCDGTIHAIISNCIYIDKTNLKPRIQNQIRRIAAVSNPTYFKNKAMGLSNFNNSRYIYMGYDDSGYICIPRGLFDEIERKCQEDEIDLTVLDERCEGRKLSVSFTGQLREEQQKAVDYFKDKDTGILSAATAFGKTVVCSNIIATKKVSTLILLESSALIEQWQDALETFLDINEELPEYLTKTGRIKKRKSLIGVIHGSKDTSTGIIDIAMVGSLKKKGEFHERLKSNGMVIVDECHHSASDTMSEVLMEVCAKYVYGVTATPFRGDGLEKINNMLLGPIRFQYTAKEKAESQGIDHIVIPRFTRVVNPHGQNKMHINDAYEILRSSSVRNEQICEDIRKCISEGRTPVVLSKFVEHAELIYDNIKNYADKVFLLTGSQTRKQQKMIRQEMNSISNDESMILVATGQLVGEGFDFPRLDTLIMATPVAWKGLVEQYAGRLNRDYEGKENVVIFDYIDSNIRVFDNMYAKRLKAYKRIGYSLQGEPGIQKQKANAIYDYESYAEVYCRDLADAKTSIVVSSPSLRYRKVNTFISDMKPLQEKGVTITVLTWNPDSYNFGSSIHKMEILRTLNEAGIEVVLKEENCLHFAVIDNSIVWYGSLNLLGKEDVEDDIMRIDNDEIAAELFELSFGRSQ